MLHDNDDPDARLRALEGGLPPRQLESAIDETIQRLKAEQVGLDCIVGGALFDFAAFLSSRRGITHDSDCAIMAEAVGAFMQLRELDTNKELRVQDWRAFLPVDK